MLIYKHEEWHSMYMIIASECILLYTATKIEQHNITWAKLLYCLKSDDWFHLLVDW